VARSTASASATTLGQAIEDDVLADLASATPGEWRYQVKVETEWFRGTADAVLYEPRRGDCAEHGLGTCSHAVLVADSKSANTASWEIKERQGSCGDEIEAQLQLYMHALGAKRAIAVFRKTGGNAKDMAKGVYLPIEFPYRPEVVKRLHGTAQSALRAAREHGDGEAFVPSRAFAQTAWQCQYCSYKGICWGGEK